MTANDHDQQPSRADFARTVELAPYNPATDSFSPQVPELVPDELHTCPTCGGAGQVLYRVREVRRHD